jgi:hypothetical protein
LKWVAAGGTLIVYDVGKAADQSADLARVLELPSRPPQSQTWRPANPAEFKTITVIQEGGTSLMMPGMPGGAPAAAVVSGPGFAVELTPTVVDAQGNVVSLDTHAGGWTVAAETFSRTESLAGQIFAFPGNPFPGSASDWAWWLNTAKLGNLKFTTRNGISSRQAHPEFLEFLIKGVGAIPVISFVVLITIFAALIGPVNYFVVWRRKQLYLLVLTIPVIAVLTTSSLFGYAMIADGFGVQSRLRSFTVLDQYSKTAVSFNRISLYAGLVPSSGLKFSPDTAVFPVWPDHDCLESGNVDWTDTQHLARGWLRSRTPAQFETIAVRAERARIDVKAAGSAQLDVANGLEWDVELLIVKDETGKLYAARKLPAGASTKAGVAGPEDLQALTKFVSDDALQAPQGAAGIESYSPFSRSGRRAWMYYTQQETPASFKGSTLENNLRMLSKAAQEPSAGGLPLRTYVAVFSRNPGIELGIERTRPSGGLHILLGYY